jgi:hypothetical protein
MGAGSGPPVRTRVINQGSNVLLIHWENVPDEEITLLFQEGKQHAHPLSSSVQQIEVIRTDCSSIYGHP